VWALVPLTVPDSISDADWLDDQRGRYGVCVRDHVNVGSHVELENSAEGTAFRQVLTGFGDSR
jgi:hypothetical protein